jgi:hypothetical protein
MPSLLLMHAELGTDCAGEVRAEGHGRLAIFACSVCGECFGVMEWGLLRALSRKLVVD